MPTQDNERPTRVIHAEPRMVSIERDEYNRLKDIEAKYRGLIHIRNDITLTTCTKCGQKTGDPIYVKHPAAPNPMCPECARTWKPKKETP